MEDDFHLETVGTGHSALMVYLVLCAAAGVPLSWPKTAGGDAELLHSSYKLGILWRRAELFVRWTSEVVSARAVNMTTLEEGFGRVTRVASALEHERPLLGPL